jgi:hypothetical protein
MVPALFSVVFFGGCVAVPMPTAEELRTTVVPLHKNTESISVSVIPAVNSGAEGTNEVGTKEFELGICDSIESSALFAEVLDHNTADYTLFVRFSPPDIPAFALTSSVTLESDWTLIKVQSNSVVWQNTITTTGTASFTEKPFGPARSNLAFVRAAQETIEQGLQDIGALDLHM